MNRATMATPAVAVDTWSALRAVAVQHPQRAALLHVETGTDDEVPCVLSYEQLLAGITQIANGLYRLGNGPGLGCIGLLLPGSVEHHQAMWAAQAAATVFSLNPLLRAEHLAELLRASGARVLLAPGPREGDAMASALWHKALQIQQMLPSLHWLVRLGGDAVFASNVIGLDELMAGMRSDVLDFTPAASGEAPRLAALFHTGGTTGAPRIVRHTHGNQLSAASGFATLAQLQPGDVISNGFPLFHVAGAIICSLAPWLAGATVLNLSNAGFRSPAMVANYWRLVQRHRITIAGGVPTAIGAVAAVPVAGADITSIRSGYTGGALVPRSVALAFEAATGRSLREVYGMTETAGLIAADSVAEERRLGCAGRPAAGMRCEVRMLQPDGRPGPACPDGQAGVLVVGGPSVTPGYLDPAQDREAFTADGLLITGDLARIEADGRITITGRCKDLIIRSGHNIDPAVVEEALMADPDVLVAAVVGQPDHYAGELPVAYVVMRPGVVFDVERLMASARERISERPAWPRLLIAIDTLPLTAIGKVYKPALRCDAAKRLVVELLEGLPVASVDVREEAGRGMCVTVGLPEGTPGNADLAAAVRRQLDGLLIELAIEGVSAPA